MVNEAAVRARAAADSLLAGALDAMTASVAILDADGVIVFVNESWREFGVANGLKLPASGLGSSYLAFCDVAMENGDDGGRVAGEAIRDLLAGRLRHAMFEYPCHSPGAHRWFTFRASAFRVEGERFVVVAHENITKRHVAEEALRASHAALEQFNLAVSHDIRAPLRRIEDLSRLAEESARESSIEATEILARIRVEADRARSLANDLLGLSGITAYALSPTPVDITQMVREIVDTLRVSEPKRLVEIIIEPDMRVIADARLVRLALTNLLSNAWKFTRTAAAPRIEVGSALSREGAPCFFVRDNGVGFDQADAARLFQPFVRLASAGSTEGTGVGLAIVRRAVERGGGRVWAESSPGHGATFFFTVGGE